MTDTMCNHENVLVFFPINVNLLLLYQSPRNFVSSQLAVFDSKIIVSKMKNRGQMTIPKD